MKTLLHAAWIAPMDRPPLRDGGLVFSNGRIIAVGPAAQLRCEHPDALRHALGDAVILPGLVNAHTHLELSDCNRGDPPAGGFADWLTGMLSRTRLTPEELADKTRRGVTAGVAQCLRFGVSTVGDISRQCAITRPMLQDSALRVVSYGEVMAMAQRRNLLEERLAMAADQACATDRLHIGITPHSPYSVEPEGYRRCLQVARMAGLPLATHLAESADEATFLAGHTGPLRRLWDQWLTWDDQVPRFTGGPIRFAQSLGLLEYPTLLAHVNYCDDDELAILAGGRASVVYCPRTHAFFNHPPHRFGEMLTRRINVAIGTDSCASSPDLNLVDDLRIVHRVAPQMPASSIWEMATTCAARAVGLEQQVGSLAAGKVADMTAFPAAGNDPLLDILETGRLPAQMWIAGECAAIG